MIRSASDLAAAKQEGALCATCSLEVASMCKRLGCAEESVQMRDTADILRGTGSVRRPRPRPDRRSRLRESTEEGGFLYRVGYWVFYSLMGAAATAAITTALQVAAR